MRLALISFGIVLGVCAMAPPVVLSAELAEIRERGYVIVAVKDNWRPLGFLNESGDWVGLEIDIARQLAYEILGNPEAISLRAVPNSERLSAVLEGEVDFAIAGVAMTSTRARLVSFSVPYYLDGTAVITRNPTVVSLEDLWGQRIGILEGSDAIAAVRYILPSAQLTAVASYQAALDRLERREVDAFAGDVTVLAGWVQEHPTYRILPSVLSAEPLAVVMPKGVQYKELRTLVNDSLNRWHENGWLEERATYWGLP